MSKTDLIVQLLASKVPKAEIMVRAQCSQALVYRVQKEKAAEIAQIQAGGSPAPTKEPTPGAAPGAPAEQPKAPERARLAIPTLDPDKPQAPQLEQMAWQIIAQAAAGDYEITKKQHDAARDILKAALRDRQPPPTDRKMVFKIDVIDFKDGGFCPVASNTYEIKA